jgi:DNA-directed RNA polymerase beta' subunit
MKYSNGNRTNRQPSLHEYSIFALKVRLVEGYAIHFPIAICSPLNADFDGDTVSLTLVPEEYADETYRKMSPRYVTYYKKNMKPIPEINHETLKFEAWVL